jgi:hypothetical protein
MFEACLQENLTTQPVQPVIVNPALLWLIDGRQLQNYFVDIGFDKIKTAKMLTDRQIF